MRANAYLPQLATNDSPMPGRPKHISSVLDLQLDARRSYADLIAKDEFHNLLVQKSWIQFDVLVAFDEIERLLDRTIQRIEGQL